MRILLLAPPGAGKGTQGTALAAHFGVAHISSGDLLRSEIAAGTPLGRQVQEYLDAGDLVPDEVMEELLRPIVVQAAHAGGYVLDGFPRTLHQSEQAAEIAANLHVQLEAVLFLTVPDHLLVERLVGRARGADDTPATIHHRLELFHAETEPLVERYRERGLLRQIDGTGAPDDVTAACVAALADLDG